MRELISAWDRTGKNITAIAYYILTLVLTVFMDIVGMARLARGFLPPAIFYFFLSLLSLLFFYYVSDRIREGTLDKPIGKAYPLVVFGFIFCLTALFFIDGGLRGGAFLFFILAFVATPCFFHLKDGLVMMAIELAAYAVNIALALKYPHSTHGEGYDIVDLLLPLTLVAVALGALCLLYTYAYHHQKDNLTVALMEAQSATEAKSRFLDNMSHEIRTPMNTILGMNEMILREENRPEILEYAGQIQRSGLALLSVINDILDYSKIQDNKMQIAPIRYDLSSLINDMVNVAVDLTKRKSLDFQIFADRDIPRVLIGDEFHIRQIILNIVNNAVKYTERGGVTFRVDHEKIDDESILLRVSVEDTGVGIREEDMEKIFAPFEQAGTGAVLRPEGAGLGLSIVRSLLALMDSKLEIRSKRGEGSAFSFAIRQQVQNWEPLGDYTHAFREATAHATKRQFFVAPDARVLVVDDTPVNLVVFQNLLKDTQIKIDTATSGEEMLQMARVRTYDMIFLDHRMPGMDGVQAFHTMQNMKGNRNPDTPVIALTANAVMGARQMYLDEGFKDYLSKPIDSIRLEQMIRAHLPKRLITDVEAPQDDEASGPDGALPDANANAFTTDEAASDPDEIYKHLAGIDYDAAVVNCGSAATFKAALKVYYDTLKDNADNIETYAANGDLRNYTILVHALKSSSRLIGALQLSQDALHLEEAGNAEDKAEIDAKTPRLLADYRAYLDVLEPLYGKADEAELPEMTQDEVRAMYDEIRSYADEFDLDALDAVVERAEKYRLPENERERFECVKISIRGADWSALEEALS